MELVHESIEGCGRRCIDRCCLRNMKYVVIVSAVLLSLNGLGQSQKIPYPKPAPDSAVTTFLPGIVSKETVDFGSAFSPDGRSFYFARSEDKRSRIYVTHHDGEVWTEPVVARFIASDYADADPAFGPGGRLYFISTRPKDQLDKLPDYDIWFVTPLADGGWSEPENLKTTNSESNEFYISFSRNGNLYFASSRPGGFGEEDIYVSRLLRNQYAAPENLGASINSEKSEYDPGISADEDLLVFTSAGRKDSFGGADLYASKFGRNKRWTEAVNLGKNYNSKTREYCPYFSPDSKYFFYSSEGDVKWADTQILKNHIDKLLK